MYLFLMISVRPNTGISYLLDRSSPNYHVGRTTAEDKLKISFSIPQGTLPWQPNSVVFSAWVSLDAGGAARCPASSYTNIIRITEIKCQ